MHRPCLLAVLLAAPLVHADPLSQADREALIEKLESLRESAKEKAMGRIGNAATAFKAAMASDDATLELYLKCVEKVNFDDRKLSKQDFREWERGQKDNLKKPSTVRGMRHQLRWLILSLEAAESNGKFDALAPKASEALDAIFGNPEQFEGDVGPLRDPVTNTVFAKAYNLGNGKIENWPLSPLELPQVFNQVVFPPLRAGQKFDALREQWLKRIRYEGLIKDHWGDLARERGRGEEIRVKKQGEHSPEFEKFVAETLPDLKWQMEEDLFKSGDQKRAALNMLQHLEEYLTDPKAREWAARFKNLVEPSKDATPAETAEKAVE